MDVIIDIAAPTPARYDVAGTIAAALRRALSRHGEWGQFSGRLTVTPQGRPTVSRVRVACRPVVTMPNWTNRADAPRDLQAKWDRMYAALERHERGHEDILRRIANEFRDDVQAMDPAPDRNRLRRLGRELLREHRARQVSYDRATSHGQRDGVDLPD